MPSTFSLTLSKWALDAASRLIKADVRLHNAENIEDDMAVIFTVNHFTRLETLLLPWTIYRETGREVMGLAAADLFKGRVGQFLQNTGTISTKAPDRDTIIIRSLLKGENPWMIFPEGAMIKDRKVVNHLGEFEVYNNGERRPPHKGAAVLALRAAFYRHKLECIHARPDHEEDLQTALGMFNLDSIEGVLNRRTCIIPVNITYYPIRAHENFALRMARRLNEDLSPRAVEELSVEGTVLGEETDIDITLGEPIDVMSYLNAPEYAEMMACGLHDLDDLEVDPGSLFNNAARDLMQRYMREIYQLTTINYDHIFATLIRYQGRRPASEEDYRRRIFLVARRLRQLGCRRIHEILETTAPALLYGEKSTKFCDFLQLCLREGILREENGRFRRQDMLSDEKWDFNSVRTHNLTRVIANEFEPFADASEYTRRLSQRPRWYIARRIRHEFLQLDMNLFEEDYARFYDPELSKGPEVGRPFFLCPWRVRGGVILSHGYMAAPLEIRALAEYLYRNGYAVYGVRLKGHGTSPEDLAQTPWEEWYESFNRGYAVLKAVTDTVFAGGFSTGGCVALIAAARKDRNLAGVFSICAPLKLQNYSVHLAPSLVTLNALLKRVSWNREGWDFVENHPENPHINYMRNPLKGVRELVKIMNVMDDALGEVTIPALVLQASEDKTVNPVSAQLIFDRLGSPDRELTFFQRKRHGIVNGPGSEAIFERTYRFLERIRHNMYYKADVRTSIPEKTC